MPTWLGGVLIAPAAVPDSIELFGLGDESSAVTERRLPGNDRADGPSPPPPVPSSTPASSWDRWFYLAVGILIGLAVTGAIWATWPDRDGITQTDVDAAITEAIDRAAATGEAEATAAYDGISPSLAIVRITEPEAGPDGRPTIGAGVIINDRGQVMTANHIVANAASIEVVFADGTETSAVVLSSDPGKDIALLQTAVRPGVIVAATMGNSRTLRIGDPVYAIGNPLGLTGSISAGVISGLGRNIPFPGEDTIVLRDLIQFDAAVNQGSSGGPLLNADGQVIGIITALADPAGQGFFIGIGFAIPIDIAASAAADGPTQ